MTTAIDELDEAVHALLPPTEATGGPSGATLLQTLPGVGPHAAGTLLGELRGFTRFSNARTRVAYVGFYPSSAER
jgi:transposase